MNEDDERKISVKEKVGMAVAALAVEAHHSAEPSIGMLSLKEMIYLAGPKSGFLPATTAFPLTVGRSARHVTARGCRVCSGVSVHVQDCQDDCRIRHCSFVK